MSPLCIYFPRGDYAHEKNRHGFELLLRHAEAIGQWTACTDPESADVVWSPSQPTRYPNARRVLYGPHFSVFPDHRYQMLPRDPRNVYILPSVWCHDLWKAMCEAHVRLAVAPFPVDVDRFSPDPSVTRTECLLYVKRRSSDDITTVVNLLRAHGIHYRLFDYTMRYAESEFIDSLRRARFALWVGCHESQGFALEEALAMDVPLFVWSTNRMHQEKGMEHEYRLIHTECTTVPYWDARCGTVITNAEDLSSAFDDFLRKIEEKRYSPRAFVLENLTAAAVYAKFWRPLTEMKCEEVEEV